jgi:regulatory protein
MLAGVADDISLNKALRLLALRSRTVQELDRALAKAGVASGERRSALARLRELGYINDREVARARARTRVDRGDAPRLAAKRLAAAGIAEADAREAAMAAAEGAAEEELAAKALQGRLRGRKPADVREKQRLLRALIARGHRPSAAAKVLGVEWEGDDEIDDQ